MIVWMIQEESLEGEYFRLRWEDGKFVAEVFNESSTEWTKYLWDVKDKNFIDGKLDILVVEVNHDKT